jgi:hypothetical protein
MKKTEIKIIRRDQTDYLEEAINEYLGKIYVECSKTDEGKELVDIKFTEDDTGITAFIIYTIG